MSCYQDRVICHPCAYSRPTWWTHNPKFHRIETWLSCTSLTPKYPLHLAHMEFSSHRSMDRSLFGSYDFQHAEDLVRIIHANLKFAQSRQKSQYDRHHQDMVYQPGEKAYLRVTPMRGAHHFVIKGKLAPCYIGPFTVL